MTIKDERYRARLLEALTRLSPRINWQICPCYDSKWCFISGWVTINGDYVGRSIGHDMGVWLDRPVDDEASIEEAAEQAVNVVIRQLTSYFGENYG